VSGPRPLTHHGLKLKPSEPGRRGARGRGEDRPGAGGRGARFLSPSASPIPLCSVTPSTVLMSRKRLGSCHYYRRGN
jgi:hypothetical protein